MTRVMRAARRLTGVLAGLALGCAAMVGGARAQPLTVATYNVRNYTLAHRQTPEGFRPDYPKPEAEKAALRAVISGMNADVVALQEIGGPAYLEELRRDLRSEGVDYAYGHAMMGADEARGLAVLSRVPLGAVVAHRDLAARRRGAEDPEPVRRGLLQVEVPRVNGSITLFVLHLKSRLGVEKDDPQAEDQRVAEAQAARDRVLQVFPDPERALFVILGDFNDLPGSRALKAVENRGKLRVASWVDAADSRGHRWTHAYERLGLYSRFDHVFVSGGLGRRIQRAWIADGYKVGEASDHRPLLMLLSER